MMKKSVLIWGVAGFLGVLGVLNSAQSVFAAGGTFAGGDGSIGNPWQIEDCADLQSINNDSAASYVLVSDIDCDGVSFSSLNAFSGALDGDTHTISNITISAGSSPYQGLFSILGEDAVISRLGIVNISITGGPYVGALAGVADGTISEVFATGTLSCGNYCGGLIGVSSGSLTRSYTRVFVTGGTYVGGVAGVTGPGSVTGELYAAGSVSTGIYSGGVVGAAGPGGTEDSFFDEDIAGISGGFGSGTPKTTLEMKSVATFTSSASDGLSSPWDFVGDPFDDNSSDDFWDMDPGFNDGYPYFTWQHTDASPPSAPTNFDADDSGDDVVLTWTNPAAGDFASVTIRRSTVSAPLLSTDGTAVTSSISVQTYTQSDLDDGVYYYSIFAFDTKGNVSLRATATVTVDTLPPVITMLGDSTVSINMGMSYTDAGATAIDGVDGDLTGAITLAGSVNTTQTGTYTLVYSVSDTRGNTATTTARVVRVLAVGGGYIFPQQPTPRGGGVFSVVINNGARATDNKTVTLYFNADPGTTTGYAVSVREDFVGAGIMSYTDRALYDLPDLSGSYAVYVKFFSKTGHASPVVSANIQYDALPVEMPAPVKMPKPLDVPDFKFTRLLKKGYTGEDVRQLQVLLNKNGYTVSQSGPGSPGNESDTYGPRTYAAVLRFQNDNARSILTPLGLQVGTGMAGSRTIEALFNKKE